MIQLEGAAFVDIQPFLYKIFIPSRERENMSHLGKRKVLKSSTQKCLGKGNMLVPGSLQNFTNILSRLNPFFLEIGAVVSFFWRRKKQRNFTRISPNVF